METIDREALDQLMETSNLQSFSVNNTVDNLRLQEVHRGPALNKRYHFVNEQLIEKKQYNRLLETLAGLVTKERLLKYQTPSGDIVKLVYFNDTLESMQREHINRDNVKVITAIKYLEAI